jgi:type IV pilus assembly protein PilB
VTKPNHDEVRALAITEGTRTLQHEAVLAVGAGVTTIAEVIRGIYVL